MAEPRFGGDDDLPRTLRRAREERDRELRERAGEPAQPAPMAAPEPVGSAPRLDYAAEHAPPLSIARAGTVSRLELPFLHLVRFFLKAVFAAIPALLLLAVLLWSAGQGLKFFFPQLGRMQIKIDFVGGEPPAPAQSTPAQFTPASPPAQSAPAPAKR